MALNIVLFNTALVKVTFCAAIEDTAKILTSFFFFMNLHMLF